MVHCMINNLGFSGNFSSRHNLLEEGGTDGTHLQCKITSYPYTHKNESAIKECVVDDEEEGWLQVPWSIGHSKFFSM